MTTFVIWAILLNLCILACDTNHSSQALKICSLLLSMYIVVEVLQGSLKGCDGWCVRLVCLYIIQELLCLGAHAPGAYGNRPVCLSVSHSV